MNRERMQRWVDALRSGQYAQGIGLLRRAAWIPDGPDVFCCLGVLCELAVADGVIPPPMSATVKPYQYLGCTGLAPFEVTSWLAGEASGGPLIPIEVAADVLGPDRVAGWVRRRATALTLPILNDEVAATFDEIAEMLERAYLTEAAS